MRVQRSSRRARGFDLVAAEPLGKANIAPTVAVLEVEQKHFGADDHESDNCGADT
jgi:hypothetical protein